MSWFEESHLRLMFLLVELGSIEESIKIIREREPFENNLMFVVVERIWRSFVLCGGRVHFECSIVAPFG